MAGQRRSQITGSSETKRVHAGVAKPPLIAATDIRLTKPTGRRVISPNAIIIPTAIAISAILYWAFDLDIGRVTVAFVFGMIAYAMIRGT